MGPPLAGQISKIARRNATLVDPDQALRFSPSSVHPLCHGQIFAFSVEKLEVSPGLSSPREVLKKSPAPEWSDG